MLTLDSKVILPDGKEVECKYYEIENICKKLIEEYISENEEHKNEFMEFAKKYKTFKPYFDFVLMNMGAKILNPLLESNSVIYSAKNKESFLIESLEDDTCKYGFSASNDELLNIKPMDDDYENYRDCIVAPDGSFIMPQDNAWHIYVIRQITNLLLINNEAVAKELMQNPGLESGYFLSRYYPFIRFQADKSNEGKYVMHAFYRDSNVTDELIDFMSKLSEVDDIDGSFIKIDRHDDVEFTCDLSYTLKNDMYEKEKIL